MDGPRGTRTSLTTAEAILPFPAPVAQIPQTTAFRSTWIVSSLMSLRLHGHFDRYRAALRAYEGELLSCVAGSWLPMRVVRAHYEACDALGLRPEEIVELGRGEGGSVRRTWHAQVIGAALRESATPWSLLSQLQRLWQRGAEGGAVAVFRTGERQARVEYVACELFDIVYFRSAVRAVLVIYLGRVCEDVHVSTTAGPERGQVTYQVRW